MADFMVNMSPLTTKELQNFHKTDRELFCFLIFKLHRDITQSLLVMALWLWLENTGFPNLIYTITALPNPSLVKSIFAEAVACITVIETENPVIPMDGGLNLTRRITKRYITMRLFHLKRHTAIAGIRSVLKNICSRIFSDILHIAIKKRNASANEESKASSSSSTSSSSRRSSPKRTNSVLPGFPHPLFGRFDLTPEAPKLNLLDDSIWKMGQRPSSEVTREDRSMFLTFSKGFPVSDKEVKLLFDSRYGICVESVSMAVKEYLNCQKLFGVLVLKDVATVDRILRGQRIAKLVFHGKHVWARKFEFRWD